MVRTVWALIQGTRRLYLVDDTCTFLEPVNRYLEALDIQGKSPNTLESYCRHLKHYFTFLEEARLDWRAVAPDDLLRFVEWLRNPHRQMQVQPLHLTSRLSERSVNTILAAVASFYRYHVQRGQVLANPVLYEEVSNRFSRFKPFLVHTSRGKMTRRGVTLREPKRRIRPIGDEAFARFQDETHNVQFQCILLLMRDGGLRVGEVLGLHIQDLEFHRNGVVIRRRAGLANGALAKGMVEHEERFIELTPEVMALLDHLVLHHTFETDQVFVVLNKSARNQRGESTYGTPLSRHALKAMFRYYSQKSGIPLHAHLLRHTHATELIRAGWDASYVQQRLGHANVQTTINTYVHLDDDDLRQKWQAYQERRAQHVRPTPPAH